MLVGLCVGKVLRSPWRLTSEVCRHIYMTMWQVSQTAQFEKWMLGLRDRTARRAIAVRIERVQAGNLGDHASVGDGVSELRIHHGAGYRLYYIIRGQEIVLLLCGGTKADQQRDIKHAKDLAGRI